MGRGTRQMRIITNNYEGVTGMSQEQGEKKKVFRVERVEVLELNPTGREKYSFGDRSRRGTRWRGAEIPRVGGNFNAGRAKTKGS